MPTNEVDAFLGELDNKEQDVFSPTNEDPFKAKEEVKTEAKVEEKTEEEKLPFHKDPKLQRFIEKEVAKKLAQQPTEVQRFTQETKTDSSDSLMDVLTEIIGNDTPQKIAAAKRFRDELGGLKDSARADVMKEIQAQQEAERREDEQAENELTSGLESIEERFGVDITSNSPQARKNRTEYLTYIERIAPKDEYGQVTAYPDFEASFEDFQERSKRAQPNTRAKELASRSMARSGDGAAVAPITDRSWSAVDKIIAKLTG